MVLKKTVQRGNQKPYIGEQTIQWYLRKSTKEVIRSVNRGTENTMELKKKDQRGNQEP